LRASRPQSPLRKLPAAMTFLASFPLLFAAAWLSLADPAGKDGAPAAIASPSAISSTADPRMLLPPPLLQGNTRSELEDLARRIPCLDLGALLWGRKLDDPGNPQWMEAEELAALAQFSRAQHAYPLEDLVGLLRHADAKVRVLAIAALHARMDPKRTLPCLQGMLTDEAQAFPTRQIASYAWPIPADRKRLRNDAIGEPMTVGQVASSVMGCYMSGHALLGQPWVNQEKSSWQAYWDQRKDREYCLFWWSAALAHATGGTTPFQQERAERVAALRRRIDALPSVEKQWYLLLLADPEAHPLVGAEERLALAKALGWQALQHFLRGNAPFDDPDLQFPVDRASGVWWTRLSAFVLEHASELLQGVHADELIEMWGKHRERAANNQFGLDDARWLAAAAVLMPQRAEEIIDNGLRHYAAPPAEDHRVTLYRALWLARGEAAMPKVLDGVFTERSPLWAIGFGQSRFFHSMRTADAALLHAFLRDERMAKLDADALYHLGLATNRVAGKDVVAWDVLQKLPRSPGSARNDELLQQVRTALQRYGVQ